MIKTQSCHYSISTILLLCQMEQYKINNLLFYKNLKIMPGNMSQHKLFKFYYFQIYVISLLQDKLWIKLE